MFWLFANMNTVFLLVLHVFNKHSFGACSSASLMTESLKRPFPWVTSWKGRGYPYSKCYAFHTDQIGNESLFPSRIGSLLKECFFLLQSLFTGRRKIRLFVIPSLNNWRSQSFWMSASVHFPPFFSAVKEVSYVSKWLKFSYIWGI